MIERTHSASSRTAAGRCETLTLVRAHLERVADALRMRGVPVPGLEGKLLRPLIAYAFVPPGRRASLDDRFWFGALAIQMVHEASLLHDDILDGASARRGAPTLSARRGVGPALVLGDHYLTGAYRAALATGSPDFLQRFICAVERTVAGEVRQADSVGTAVDLATYFDVVLGKSGELLGAAAALGACVLGLDDADERTSLGRQIGALYQQVDDLLDYCPQATTGKEPLKDYRQRKWTWLLEVAGVDAFDATDAEVLDAVFGRSLGISAAERAVRALEIRRDGLVRTLCAVAGDDALLADILGEWIEAAREGVEAQLAARVPVASEGASAVDTPRAARRAARRAPRSPQERGRGSPESFVFAAARSVGGPQEWPRYFARHARTFSLAARLFPARERAKVTALYAFCRFTDDLVDLASDPTDVVAARLRAWRELTRGAFAGARTDIPLLDAAVRDALEAGVAWSYADALLSGAAMDLEARSYAGWPELERYTFCVAGAVGGWMAQLFGVREPGLLEQAHALGHAMQLTNIARDVGEDLMRGRLYVPASLLAKHDVSRGDLEAALSPGGALPAGWGRAMEELMARADAQYERSRPGLRALPAFFRRPAAAAAEAYRGIHGALRRNGYDNFRHRARTRLLTRLRLSLTGVLRAERALIGMRETSADVRRFAELAP